MKKIIFIVVSIYLGMLKVYPVSMEDFVIISKNKNTSIEITETKENILNKFNKDSIIKNELNNSCENYLLDDVDIVFLGEKVISIILQNNKYYLTSEIKIGDTIDIVYKKYRTPNYKGNFSNGDCFIDYYVRLQTDSPWKEPMYTLRFIYFDNKIKKISMFYTE